MTQDSRVPIIANRLARDPRLAGRFVHFYERLRALPRAQRRWLGRRARLSLAAAALLLALSRAPAAPPVWADTAATITVANGEVALANNQICSLIEAINNANDTVDGIADESGHDDCAPGNPNGADVIVLPSGGSFTVNQSHNYDLGYSALPLITSVVTVEGNGSTITRSGRDDMRFFTAAGYDNPDTKLTLNDLTLTNGRNYYDFGGAVMGLYAGLEINNCTITGNEASAGGAIYAAYGSLTITNSTISDNVSTLGGGIYSLGNELSISNTTLQGNVSDYGAGGGLYAVGGESILNQLTVSGNDADTGGGIKIVRGTATITDSQISGNTSKLDIPEYAHYSQGGGLYLQGSTVTIRGTTINGNSAFKGAGVAVIDGPVTIVNSTLSGNEAESIGGGVFNSGNLSLVNSTMTGNSAADSGGGAEVGAGTLTLQRSLVAGNTAPAGREVNRTGGTVAANNHNLFGFGGNGGLNGTVPGATDIVPGSTMAGILGPLADNGGPTQTHALVNGSPAIDAAPSADCMAEPVNGVDQRGLGRNANGDGADSANECDIGAFEFGAGTPPPPDFKVHVPVILR